MMLSQASPDTMNTQVLLDNVLLPASSARVSVMSEGFLYGHGVFETIHVRDGLAAFLPQHHARLTASARDLDLSYAVPVDTLRERIQRVITANTLTSGSIKVLLFNNGETTGELILIRTFAYPPEAYERGFRLQTIFTGERTGGLSGHKTTNYLTNIRAKRAAQAARFDEPLFLTPAGLVIEGATTNIFTVRHGVVHTPSLACGPLPGIARSVILAHVGARARETLITHTELNEADELFVTSSLLGVMPVTQVDDRKLSTGPVTRELARVFNELETRSLS
jgi:branched-subunit amino acid aminotransferase/4-amino-4-deoxychorismate lyase